MPKKTNPKVAPQPNLDNREAEVAALKERLARALADYDNLEKRFARESSAVVKFANASLVQKLLTVRDHLEMASSHLKDQSLTMILSNLDRILQEEGLKEIKAEGMFDPATMECQEQEAGEHNQVIRVTQKGYMLQDRVIRPARVVVGNGQPAVKNSNNKQEDQNV